MPKMSELLHYIAKNLVDAPDDVQVNELGGDVLELRVAPDDRGKVIGKKGRTAHAIRAVLAAASPDGHPVSLDIVD